MSDPNPNTSQTAFAGRTPPLKGVQPGQGNVTATMFQEHIDDANHRIDLIEEGYLARANRNRQSIHQLLTWTKAMLVLVVIVLAGGGISTIITFHRIQSSREESIRQQCLDTNQRYDKTIAYINALAAKRLKTVSPKQAILIKAQTAQTLLIINDLTPKRNCEQRVHQLIQ